MTERRYRVYRCEEGPEGDGGDRCRRRRGRRTASESGATPSASNAAADGRRGAGPAAGPPRGRSGSGSGGPREPGDAPPRQVYARPRRRWLAVLRYAALLIIAVVCGLGGYALGWLQSTGAVMVEGEKAKVVDAAELEITKSTSGEPINILIMGSDRRDTIEDDPGRSDTLMLLRLDPNTGSISMLSVPRDLWVEIPGYGSERINVAYTLEGPKGAIKVFKQLTGLDIHYWMDVNFLGFVRVVDYLRGVYIDVDHRYYNPPGTGYAAIDIQPGYQLLKGRPALQFVRFRHDEYGDFGRMVRQQVFLHEVERQARRWQNWTRLPRIVKKVAENTISNINEAGELLGLAKTLLTMDTSQVYKTHIVGEPTMINEMSVLLPSDQEIKQAVNEFLDPERAPVSVGKITIPRDSYTVRVLNGSGTQGIAGQVAADLDAEGFHAVEDGNADGFDYSNSVVYTTEGLKPAAQAVARLLNPCTVKIVAHLPGTLDGMTVIVGGDYDGQIVEPEDSAVVVQQQLEKGTKANAAEWQMWAGETPLPLMMPADWSPGMTWDVSQWRAYTIPTHKGKKAAFVAVGKTAAGGYWHLQVTSWDDPPILEDPSEARRVDGRQYHLYYQNARLHRVSWRVGGTVYWITNTLDDQIANKVLLGLATSCVKVR
jgi:LCP family protein required for cell wall assembly